ncbi:DUF2064 domain-containing protein [Saccharomonospora piscinae]|uniref:TIGR04282 family arsenosugar biosynthesis glycosyltransferase n=1 Tax=Saccharomonospora piscinae TaxID=687388 RepID=UPI001105CFF4|nr:DUF2064 domain-containing protein [Saccharomonospora piscinae]TLW94990.1 DUF2064 domain-containing protein [Saccharomonospora piscinae]
MSGAGRHARVVLVVAKAPVAGLAKTRLAESLGSVAAARIAAAALLDTLDAALATPGTRTLVALAGDLASAEQGESVRALLAGCDVVAQRGATFAERLAHAHEDVALAYPGARVVQIGMDTPQVSPDLLATALSRLDDADGVVGPAADGGWWALALRDPRAAEVLRAVPMSRPDTGARTEAALRTRGLRLAALPVLTDVDTLDDVNGVVARTPGSRFAAAVARALPRTVL